MTAHEALEVYVATALCGRTDPCDSCRDAARRVVVHRDQIGEMLTTFAAEEAR